MADLRQDDSDKKGEKTWHTVGKAIVASVIVTFAVASTFPLMNGVLRKISMPITFLDPVPQILLSGNLSCPDYSSEISRLQEQLKASRLEVKSLSEFLLSLEEQLLSIPTQKCEIENELEETISNINFKQSYLGKTLEALNGTVESALQQNKAMILNETSHYDKQFFSLNSTIMHAMNDIQIIDHKLQNKSAQAGMLSYISTLYQQVTNKTKIIDTRLTAIESLSIEIDVLREQAEAIVCADPIIPAVVIPTIHTNCSLTQATPTIVSSAEEKEDKNNDDSEKGETLPTRECIDLSSAQEIVSNMVFTELDMLGQNLSNHCDSTIGATMGAFLSAAENTARNALDEFIAENARMYAEHADYITTLETSARAEQQKCSAHQCPVCNASSEHQVELLNEASPDELDFALISAGASVVHQRTSQTFYPKQWNLDYKVKNALSSTGLPMADAFGDVLGGSLDAIGAGAGGELYTSLNLHKTVGVPEDALRVEDKTSACWPMQGRSGNLTVMMAGAVLISTVSIDHPSHLSTNKAARSAPRRFDVIGVNSDFNTERVLVRGVFNNTLGAPAVQDFPVLDESHRISDQPFQLVTLRVLSNYGNPDYTCLYRFRVHGRPLP